MDRFPSLSTDQIAAFVALAREGNLRAAAETLHVSEQGLRNRLLVLESRLGTELYRKSRGIRRVTPLTPTGRQFLPHAIAFLERAQELGDMFVSEATTREVNVVGSQYLITYLLIDAVRRFHAANPHIRVRLSSRTEHEIEEALRTVPEFDLGLAAPYEPSPDFNYIHLFSMPWSVITPKGHALLDKQKIRLNDLVDQPLILYERGSTGRQHILEAFQRDGLSPNVEMEATTTDLVVRMVEAGLGISIVPLIATGAVTRNRRVGIRELGRQVRPIDSGILTRKGDKLADATRQFIDFVSGESEKLRPSSGLRG